MKFASWRKKPWLRHPQVGDAITAIQESANQSMRQVETAVHSIDTATELAGHSGEALEEIVKNNGKYGGSGPGHRRRLRTTVSFQRRNQQIGYPGYNHRGGNRSCHGGSNSCGIGSCPAGTDPQ